MSDKLLFTPGPLTTSLEVKRAMLRDLGSREAEFIGVVKAVRHRLVKLAGGREPEDVAILMQGSGTFGLESVLGSVLPATGKLLVVDNGAYGARLTQIAGRLRIATHVVRLSPLVPASPEAVQTALLADPELSHVAVVHGETATGMLNPIDAIGAVVRAHRRVFIVDGMSSFGAVPLHVCEAHIDFLVSSPNKCIEGVPGFSFVVARRAALEATRGFARSLSLDLLAQLEELEASGQFRFTPPTHAILAFAQALDELDAEGGVMGRRSRYQKNHAALTEGMRRFGFRAFLAREHQGYLITSFHYPSQARFRFDDFASRLGVRGFVIYPGKIGDTDCFRIGILGRLYPTHVEALIHAIGEILGEMGIPVPLAERDDAA